MKKLNLLLSSFGYVDGPGYQRTFKIAKELAQIGHNVTFLTSQNGSHKFPYQIRLQDGVKEVAVFDFMPHKLKKLGLSFVSTFIKIYYIINKKYDVVHADSGHRWASGIPCWVHKSIYGTQYISEWWDYYGKGGQFDKKSVLWRFTYGIIDNILEIYDKKLADGVVVLSQYTMRRAKRKGIVRKRIVIVHGGADIQQIKYIPDSRYRKEYRLDNNDFVIVIVGVTDESDFEPLLSIFSELKKSIRIKIVTTGKYLNTHISNKFNFENDILELGWIDYSDYYKVLSLADMFFLYQPIDNANIAKWPNKIGDYLCAGRVVVTNPVNDVALLINTNNTSIIGCDMSPECLMKLITLFNENKAELIQLGRINRIIAESNSWRERSKQLSEFYYKILKFRTPEMV